MYCSALPRADAAGEGRSSTHMRARALQCSPGKPSGCRKARGGGGCAVEGRAELQEQAVTYLQAIR